MEIPISEVVGAAYGQRELAEVDPELAPVIAAWPNLPAHLRRAILTLVGPGIAIEEGG